MTGAVPGPLIGSGRAADVYALGDGKVLRRYRTAHSCAVGHTWPGWPGTG